MSLDVSRRALLLESLIAASVMAYPASASSPTEQRIRVFENVEELRAASDLSVGEIVVLVGRREALDGGGALWRLEGDGPADDACCLALRHGLFARLAFESQHDVRQAGIFSDTDGDFNGTALVALARHMIAGGGGIIEFSQPILSSNVVFPPIPSVAPISFEMIAGAQVTPSDPRPGVFMWDFPADETVTFPSFWNVMVSARGRDRIRCNGIRIGASNRMTIDNCFGRFIDGCAWQIEGANNARIDITTFECGSDDGIFAQNHVAHRRPDKSPNDIVLQGTTERDRYGINVEGGAILREGSAIKLHGYSQTRCALRLHRCNAFDLRVFASQQWASDGFIRISDRGGSDSSLLVEPDWLGANTRGTLTIATMYNIKYSGRGVGHWCVIDLQSPASILKVAGVIAPQAIPVHDDATFHHFQIVGPGNQGVTLDFKALCFPSDIEPTTQLQDERSDVLRSRNRLDRVGEERAKLVLTADDIVDGQVDLRGAEYCEIVVERLMVIRRVGLEMDQQCTICAPRGRLRIKNTGHIQLSRKEDFVMRPGATLTLRRVGNNRFQEISRCER